MVKYLLETYSADYTTSEMDAETMKRTQPPNRKPVEYETRLSAKALHGYLVYDE